jgi:hypothetical protein
MGQDHPFNPTVQLSIKISKTSAEPSSPPDPISSVDSSTQLLGPAKAVPHATVLQLPSSAPKHSYVSLLSSTTEAEENILRRMEACTVQALKIHSRLPGI